MECNKEEAVRATKLAEEKMKAGDFVGAHKFVTKAQRLYSNLENMQQLIAICAVHSSADEKIMGLDNWYGILQVKPFADADTIKKQYRRLALLLHPDKNKFAGAEAAFKLVGEANRLLSDITKRSQYDLRYRSHSMLAKRQSNENSGRHCAAAENAVENVAGLFSFWSCCKNCGGRSKYLVRYMNTVMHCPFCQKGYMACSISRDGVPPSSSTASKKDFQYQGMYNTFRQNASTGADSGSSATEMDKNGAVKGKLNKKDQDNQKKCVGDRKPKKEEGCTESDTEGGNPQKEETCTNNSAEIPKADILKPQPEVIEPETSAANSIPDLSAPKKNLAAKKRRKAGGESSKSFEVDGSDVAGDKTDNKRKSSRKKPQVSYTEGGDDNDFVIPPTKKTKIGCEFESDSITKQMAEDNKSPELADSGASLASSNAYKGKAKKNENSGNEDKLSAKNKESEGCDANEEDAAMSSKIDKVENGYKANGNPNTFDKPDPEFNVFEDERKTGKFAVNQVWSTCDSRDGMPRRYARVKKVLTGEFKLRITYLEPVRDKNDKTSPVAWGKFKNGETKEVKDHSSFSGRMLYLSRNKAVFICPKKGEIWAMFRDWNEEWNATLEKHKLPYKYDFVEVVSDFDNENGVGVAYLGKIKGFVSLFHRQALHGVCQIQLTPKEMRKFSHKVPAVKMTGKEKECVPAGSYELDPAALPKDIFQNDAVDMEMDSETLKGKADGPEASKVKEKAEPVQEIPPSPRKRRKSDDDSICSNHDTVCTRPVSLGEVKDGSSRSNDFSSCQGNEKNTPSISRKIGEASDAFKLRKSPRLQTTPSQQIDEKKSAKQGDRMITPKKTTKKGLVTDSVRVRKSPNGIQQQAVSEVGESLKKQGRNGELPSLSKQNDLPTQLNGSTNESPETTLVSPSCKTPRRNSFDFKSLKSEDKFKVKQIWAVYSNVKGMPTEYVMIKKIETKPEFVLYVTHMDLYPPSTDPVILPVSCGDFMLKTGRPKILRRGSFSHQVDPVDTKKNIVKVYPRKGEIWALHKKCDITEEEHDIVQVVEDYCDNREIAKAVALTSKSNSLYIIQRGQGSSNAAFIDIPKAEMSSRFSHRIPAKRHEKRTTRLGEGVYWELDPIAIPGRTIVLD